MWKVFLGLTASHHMSAQAYMKVVQEGPSTYDEKIRADTYRTFATDANFKAFVPEAKLIRLLNGYCNVSGQPYVQGMNILVAPFLVVLTEAEAFFCIQRLFSSWIPQYVYFSSSGNQQSLPGVHAGLAVR
jgi:cell cycle arrest protein BUB2